MISPSCLPLWQANFHAKGKHDLSNARKGCEPRVETVMDAIKQSVNMSCGDQLIRKGRSNQYGPAFRSASWVIDGKSSTARFYPLPEALIKKSHWNLWTCQPRSHIMAPRNGHSSSFVRTKGDHHPSAGPIGSQALYLQWAVYIFDLRLSSQSKLVS